MSISAMGGIVSGFARGGKVLEARRELPQGYISYGSQI